MRRFTNILLVSDSDPATRERAALIARQQQATLTVVQVTPSSGGDVTHQEQRLGEFIEPIRDAGIEPEVKQLSGTPFLEITREVIQQHHDLVMLTETADESNRLIDSTGQKLMRKCPCPVWIGKPASGGALRYVLAAIDPVAKDAGRHELNQRVLEVAATVAAASQAQLHVLNAWKMLGGAAMSELIGTPPDKMHTFEQEEQHERERMLQELLRECEGRLEGMVPVTHFVKGDPEIAIPEFVDSNSVDLLVMGTLCRSGLSGFFVGNTAEAIIGDIGCSLLTVKPQDFVSPVTV